jgi:hypothetical protein
MSDNLSRPETQALAHLKTVIQIRLNDSYLPALSEGRLKIIKKCPHMGKGG